MELIALGGRSLTATLELNENDSQVMKWRRRFAHLIDAFMSGRRTRHDLSHNHSL